MSRPKSAGATRRPFANGSGSGNNNNNNNNNNNSSAAPGIKYDMEPPSRYLNMNVHMNSMKNDRKNDQWSTSYKLHYGNSSNIDNSGGGANSGGINQGTSKTQKSVDMTTSVDTTKSAKSTRSGLFLNAKDFYPVFDSNSLNATDSNKNNRAQNAISSADRIRNAIAASRQAIAAMELVEVGKEAETEKTGIGALTPALTNVVNMSASPSPKMLPNHETGSKQVTKDEDDDDDEMDGKRLSIVTDSRTHPEVGTPSMTSIEQTIADIRNSGSLDSLNIIDEVTDPGISTIPNQFCTIRDAIDLKRMLLTTNEPLVAAENLNVSVMDMYMVGKVIGVGSYGKVRVAWHRLTSAKVAIKTYDKSKMKDDSHWKRVHSEIKIMEQVSHPRIARMYEAIETPKRMHLIMECLDGGNLCSHVKEKKRLNEDEAKAIFFQLMQAVEYLHNLNVSHRDIKLENVLFSNKDSSKDIKLIDFGFSTVCIPGKKLKVFCGTPSYMAPEIVKRTEYDGKAVDMWSLGILLYALLFGCFPFRAKSYPDLYRRIARGTFNLPEDVSPSVRDLLTMLLDVDSSRRITATFALRHPWLQSQFTNCPDMKILRAAVPFLISDQAIDDVDEEVLKELDRFGLSRDSMTSMIVSKYHSSQTTLYYLLLDIAIKKRRRVDPLATVILSASSIKKGILSLPIAAQPVPFLSTASPTQTQLQMQLQAPINTTTTTTTTTNVNANYPSEGNFKEIGDREKEREKERERQREKEKNDSLRPKTVGTNVTRTKAPPPSGPSPFTMNAIRTTSNTRPLSAYLTSGKRSAVMQ